MRMQSLQSSPEPGYGGRGGSVDVGHEIKPNPNGGISIIVRLHRHDVPCGRMGGRLAITVS